MPIPGMENSNKIMNLLHSLDFSSFLSSFNTDSFSALIQFLQAGVNNSKSVLSTALEIASVSAIACLFLVVTRLVKPIFSLLKQALPALLGILRFLHKFDVVVKIILAVFSFLGLSWITAAAGSAVGNFSGQIYNWVNSSEIVHRLGISFSQSSFSLVLIAALSSFMTGVAIYGINWVLSLRFMDWIVRLENDKKAKHFLRLVRQAELVSDQINYDIIKVTQAQELYSEAINLQRHLSRFIAF